MYVGGNKVDGKSDEAGVRGELLETRPGVGRRGWDLGGRFFFSYKYGQSIVIIKSSQDMWSMS